MLRPRNSSSASASLSSMPHVARASERQPQLSTSLSTRTPSQSKMIRSSSCWPAFMSAREHMPSSRAIARHFGIVRLTSLEPGPQRQFHQGGTGAAPQDFQERRSPVRDLPTMVVIGARDRETNAAARRKPPRHRQQRDADPLDLARHKRRGIVAPKAAERPCGAIAFRRRLLLAMQRAQQSFGDIALGPIGFDLGEIDEQRHVALAAAEPEIDEAMTGKLRLRRKRLGCRSEERRAAALPIPVIIAAVDAGDALVTGFRTGADSKVDLIVVLASLRRRVSETRFRRQKEAR